MIRGAATADVRIHNRTQLEHELGLDGDPDAATDVAIALRAHERWGERCPERLIGDFAFAVSDARNGRVFAARDPMGVKPLYYRVARGAIAFAPTATGVAAADGCGLELDENRIADVLVPELEASDRTSTFFRGILRLPPGHRLVFDGERAAVSSYWDPDTSTELRLASDQEYVDAFREVFAEAVRCREDDDAASMLSGGLDSSAIVGFAAAARRRADRAPLTTLSAVSDDPACEESRHVRSSLAVPGLDPVLLRASDIDAFRPELDAFLESMEEPFDASMILPLVLYAAARRRGFRAVLDGVDGDSVASLEPDYLAGLMQAGSWRDAVREASGVARFYDGTYAPWSSTARLIASSAGRAYAPSWARRLSRDLRRPGRLDGALEETILGDDLRREACVEDRLEALWALRAPARRDARARHAIELSHPNIGAALERYHRVASSQGIEARHPFMDRRVVELCLSLPWNQKVRGGWTKFIVRRACLGVLPDDVAWRKGRWVRLGPELLAAAIACSSAFIAREAETGFRELTPYVNRPKLLRAVAAYRRGNDATSAETVWRAAALNSWVRRNRSSEYDLASRANGPAALTPAP